jgi:hypothetical protein
MNVRDIEKERERAGIHMPYPTIRYMDSSSYIPSKKQNMDKSVYQWRTENCKHVTENRLNFFSIHWMILPKMISFYIKKKASPFKKYRTNVGIKFYSRFYFYALTSNAD